MRESRNKIYVNNKVNHKSYRTLDSSPMLIKIDELESDRFENIAVMET